MPNIANPDQADSMSSTEQYFFQSILPSDRYPEFMPYQVNCENADLLLTLQVGAALASYIDGWAEPVIYPTHSTAAYHAYRDTLLRPPQFASIGTFTVMFRTTMPTDNLLVETEVAYRALSSQAVAQLVAAASAGELPPLIGGWVLTHKLVLENCGGFTLLHVKVTELQPTEYRYEKPPAASVPTNNALLELGVLKKRRSFKRFLAGSNVSNTTSYS